MGGLDLGDDEAARSPSPPPIYDAAGQRTNTREVRSVSVVGPAAYPGFGGKSRLSCADLKTRPLARKREELEQERREAIGEHRNAALPPTAKLAPHAAMLSGLLAGCPALTWVFHDRRAGTGECMALNPAYKPPAGFRPVVKEAKLYIPVKDYPGYNFIGLILGPRGNTQKRMEQETGTKIAIRGKGANKEGKAGRRDAKTIEAESDHLHVHVTADTLEKVDAAVALIEPLLHPIDEERNNHKRKQLRELAEMNGTMRDFSKLLCGTCGETGHREWQCPQDKLTTFQAKVTCAACGDGGHPTADCPMRQQQAGAQGKAMDSEYRSFLEEVGHGLAGSSAGNGGTAGDARRADAPSSTNGPRASLSYGGPRPVSPMPLQRPPLAAPPGTDNGGFGGPPVGPSVPLPPWAGPAPQSSSGMGRAEGGQAAVPRAPHPGPGSANGLGRPAEAAPPSLQQLLQGPSEAAAAPFAFGPPMPQPPLQSMHGFHGPPPLSGWPPRAPPGNAMDGAAMVAPPAHFAMGLAPQAMVGQFGDGGRPMHLPPPYAPPAPVSGGPLQWLPMPGRPPPPLHGPPQQYAPFRPPPLQGGPLPPHLPQQRQPPPPPWGSQQPYDPFAPSSAGVAPGGPPPTPSPPFFGHGQAWPAPPPPWGLPARPVWHAGPAPAPCSAALAQPLAATQEPDAEYEKLMESVGVT
eukprot:SM000510S17644  [mRNA]  locus=s510:1795:5649:- [translate_table: standard]